MGMSTRGVGWARKATLTLRPFYDLLCIPHYFHPGSSPVRSTVS